MYQVIVGGCHIQGKDPNKLLGIGVTINNKPTMSWNFKEDMQHFKFVTSSNIILMGYRTWESIPENRPLPNRINIVVTSKANELNLNKKIYFGGKVSNNHITPLERSDPDYKYNYVHFARNVEEGYYFYLELLKKYDYQHTKLFVIGGETIYQQMLEKFPDQLDKLYLTEVNNEYTCDHYFPMGDYLKLPHEIIFQSPERTSANLIGLVKEKITYTMKIYQFNYANNVNDAYDDKKIKINTERQYLG